MAPYLVYGIPDEQWIDAANSARTMKVAIGTIGVSAYTSWMNLAKKHRPDLVDAMRAELIVNRERAGLPRCGNQDCGRPAKARQLCKKHYGVWLAAAAAEDKVRRAEYPSDDQIVVWFEVDYSMTKVARRIGVARETLRDYIKHHSELSKRVEFLRRLPAEVAAERNREAQRNWRRSNPEVVREINRRWAKNQDPAKRRYWNHQNRERRVGQATPMTSEQRLETVKYQQILRGDACVYCGSAANTVDHIQPINSAGVDYWENLAPACWSCNSQKNDKELLTYLLWRLENVVEAAGGGDFNPVDPDGCRS